MLETCWKKLAFRMRTSLLKTILTLDYGMSLNHLVIRSYKNYNRRQNCWHIHSFNPYSVTLIPFCPPG